MGASRRDRAFRASALRRSRARGPGFRLPRTLSILPSSSQSPSARDPPRATISLTGTPSAANSTTLARWVRVHTRGQRSPGVAASSGRRVPRQRGPRSTTFQSAIEPGESKAKALRTAITDALGTLTTGYTGRDHDPAGSLARSRSTEIAPTTSADDATTHSSAGSTSPRTASLATSRGQRHL